MKGDSAPEIRRNTREGRVIHPRARRPHFHIPESLAAVAMKALALSPEDRYPSARELHDDVVRYQRGYPPHAEQAGPGKRLQLAVRRHNKVATIAMAAGLLTMVLVTVGLVREKRLSHQMEVARYKAETNLRNFMNQRRVAKGFHEELMGFALDSNMVSVLNSYPYGYELLLAEYAKPDLGVAERNQVRMALIHLEMANQHFVRAGELIAEHPASEQSVLLKKHSDKWMLEKADDDAPLTDEQFARFIHDIAGDFALRKAISLILNLHLQKRAESSPEQYLPVVIQFLNLINEVPEWGDDLKLEKREGGWHLDLSGSPYKRFGLLGLKNTSYLEPLELFSIDLSRTEPDGSYGIHILNRAEKLIFRDLKGENLPVVGRLLVSTTRMNLKALMLTRGMFDDDTMGKLKEKYEVELVEPVLPRK